MAIIRDVGLSANTLTIGTVSKAAYMTPYDSAVRVLAPGTLATFSANGTFTPGTTPNDVITITGSAGKTIRVVSLAIATTNVTPSSWIQLLSKRSSNAAGGVFVAQTKVALDSNDTATANVGHWTASPSTPGTLVGTINTVKVAVPVTPPTTLGVSVPNVYTEMLPQIFGLVKPITLRGYVEGLSVNFNGAALLNGGFQVVSYVVVWTEE